MKRHWNKLDSLKLYRGRILNLRQDKYHFLPNDIIRDFTVLEFSDWVNIIPLTADDMVVMIRQYRHGVERETLEIPGGLISHDDPDPVHAAVREMMEETGYFSENIVHLGSVEPNPAVQNNRCHTFLARNAYLKSDQNLDPTEAIELECIPRKSVYEMIRNGTITHALVIAAFTHLMLHEGR